MQIITLDNKARLIHKPIAHTELIHCGIFINAGSRDETPENNGIAHFIEHAVFKGTQKRKANTILNFIEKVGGELNAYTTREKTCYYVSCLKEYADKAVDIICDIAFNPSFPEAEMAKEKMVIAEEIDMYNDSPDESIYDHFYELLFGGHPMSFNILGTRDSVNGLNSGMLKDFMAQHYKPEGVVLSVSGNINEKNVEHLANKYLNISPGNSAISLRNSPKVSARFEVTEKKEFAQAHCMLGNVAYSKHDEKRFALSLVNNLLGGSGMSARLNMSVREKNGLTYQVGSNFSSYQDTGVFSVYFGCDKKNINRCRKLVNKELQKLCDTRLSPTQLHQAKVQMRGQFALLEENYNIQMQSQAKTLMDYGRYYSFKDFMQRTEEVTASQILEVCNEVMKPQDQSVLIYRD